MVDATETMKLPSIAYIDEQEGARDDFFTDAYQSGLFNDVHVLAPESTLTEMVDKLLNLRIDAVISDFQLTEAGPVDYNGEALIEAVRARRAEFPCFIQTSFYNAAIHEADDVNLVYSKDPSEGTGSREQFLNRVVVQIQRHNARLTKWSAELDDLLRIDRQELTSIQVERILELDKNIEEYMGLDDSLPQQTKRDVLKNKNLAKRQAELIQETEKLISDMQRALDD